MRVDVDDTERDDGFTYTYQGAPFTGQVVERNADGMVCEQLDVVNGIPHGFDRSWHPDGTLRSEAQLAGGRAVGISRTWHSNGVLAQERELNDGGGLVAIRHWDGDPIGQPPGRRAAATPTAAATAGGPEPFTRPPGAMLIEVMDDYGCAPLWVQTSPAEPFAPCEPDDLPLSQPLAGRLEAWRHWYESMVNIADPHDSRPVGEAEQAAFDAEGRHLANRVAQELPQATVWYYRDRPPAT